MMRRYKPRQLRDYLEDGLRGTHSLGHIKGIPAIDYFSDSKVQLGHDEIAGWFLGNKAENIEIFSQLISEAISNISYGRRSFHPEDPAYVTETKKQSEGYLSAIQSLKDNFYRLTTFLNNYSAPFSSMRYQGHMNWDVTMPAMVGYFTAMLQNQNNVAYQGSPATTFLEIFAATDIGHMIGFDYNAPTPPWGHITCDGSVANLEAMWSARELRFFPIGVKVALNREYTKARDQLRVRFGGKEVLFKDLNDWQRLNLASDVILNIPADIAGYEGLKEADIWENLASVYSINALGLPRYYQDPEFLGGQDIGAPIVLVPSSKHYSWPKAASILGMGHGIEGVQPGDPEFKHSGIANVYVDEQARMSTDELKIALEACKKDKKPILLTVAVIGSTEESAVDPLADILSIRDDLRKDSKEPIDFNVHSDAAWGGYLISIIRKDFNLEWPKLEKRERSLEVESPFIDDTSKIPLNQHVIDQLKSVRYCDSVTIDPHKWGYIPYPAGSLCYRNGNMVNLVTFGAPYIGSDSQSQVEGIGESGVEGSKPGAAPAAVFLSHSVIRPSRRGYGKLMEQSVLNARVFYTYVCAMEEEGNPFFVVPFNGIPDGPGGEPGLDYIKKTFIDTEKPLEEILEDPAALAFIKTIGPDQNFADYIFNFYTDVDKKIPNTNAQKVIDLQTNLFKKVYPQSNDPKPVTDYNIMVTKTTFHRKDYGPKFMNTMAKRLKLESPDKVDAIPCMRSVVMDPWSIETKAEDSHFNFFREVFIPELRQAVLDSIKELEEPERTG